MRAFSGLIFAGILPALMPANTKTRNYEISRIKTAEKRNLTYQFLYQDRTYRVDFNPKKTELMTLELHFISYLVAPVK